MSERFKTPIRDSLRRLARRYGIVEYFADDDTLVIDGIEALANIEE